MKIDHICFAINDIQEGIDYWKSVFGYQQMTKIILNSRQKVKVVFLSKEDSLIIKLIEPLSSNLAVTNFVKNGGGFHHICFKCSDLTKKIDELTDKGLIKLVLPQPGEAFNNQDIAFLLGKYGLNIELIATDEKAGLL